jgi:hypothetical protein
LKVSFKTLKLPALKVILVYEEQPSDYLLPFKGFEYESLSYHACVIVTINLIPQYVKSN